MSTVKIMIDNRLVEAEEGKTILSAALESDIYIPHLCHHPDLPDIGACRLCIVEIDGEDEIKTSCTTPVRDGMVVHTKSEKLNEMRRLSMELMLANHVDDCTGCLKYLKCEMQSLIQYLGVSTSRLRRTLNSAPENTGNPLIIRDLNRCVVCGRCIRVCKDVRGVEVLGYQINEEGRVIVAPQRNVSLEEGGCRFCGACIEVCPTGALRDKEGVFKPHPNREIALVPCKAECPSHIDVPKYVRYIKEEKFQEAIAVVREKAPFPHSLGYVCMRFCEEGCRRKDINEAVSIRELKRFLAEKDQGLWKHAALIKPKTGKKIAVVGSGPAGLTAAYYLVKQGHEVTVFEKQSVAGGMLATGIPEYRLPREALNAEIAIIEEAGVCIKAGNPVTSLEALKEQGFDAILLAIGTGKGIKLPIPGAEFNGIYENIDFLQKVSLHEKVELGDKVVVLGGGNVAFDCARVARRLGAKEVTLACLEARENMTASIEEIEEGLEEGVRILNSKTFVSIEGTDGKVSGIKCQDVRSFAFDENKRLILDIAPDSDHIIGADTVIFAIGQRPDIPKEWGVETGRGNLILTEKNSCQVNQENIYAVGDAVYGTASVIKAIAEGRKAAAYIDIQLGGDGVIEEKLAQEQIPSDYIGKEEGFTKKERVKNSCEHAELRVSNFNEVVHCLETSDACHEASRCLQCDLRIKLTKPKFWTEYAVK
ncbi:FAD-dependent oxidoreductase [Petroclostridium sp. X23]|uniref:FAD-dependent oxidoreductase n=1 Tax=Petroclostridium sp. X23 TaxID=3045146 RepID=UPI0024ADD340|nr:FAD-dependent oxidoreductase [Petroclostridium sp. X23]WHH57801.1 FAD-dependent oxidoreductase [Petroclostridium sp. X23]